MHSSIRFLYHFRAAICLGTLLLLSSTSSAQEKVSGFLGKKLSLSAGINVSPSFQPQKSIAPTEVSSNTGGLGINKMWQANLGYAVGTNWQLGINAGVFNTSSTIDDDDYLNGFNWGVQYNYDSYEHELRQIYGTPAIRSTYYGGSIKWFVPSRGGIAPIGFYFGADVNVHNVEFDFTNVEYLASSNVGFDVYENIRFKHTDPISNAQYVETSIYYGTVVPISERVLLEWRTGAGYFSSVPSQSVDNVWYRESPAEIGFEESRKRLARAHIVKFGVSFTYLVF